jgi:hypothetical protein
VLGYFEEIIKASRVSRNEPRSNVGKTGETTNRIVRSGRSGDQENNCAEPDPGLPERSQGERMKYQIRNWYIDNEPGITIVVLALILFTIIFVYPDVMIHQWQNIHGVV